MPFLVPIFFEILSVNVRPCFPNVGVPLKRDSEKPNNRSKTQEQQTQPASTPTAPPPASEELFIFLFFYFFLRTPLAMHLHPRARPNLDKPDWMDASSCSPGSNLCSCGVCSSSRDALGCKGIGKTSGT